MNGWDVLTTSLDTASSILDSVSKTEKYIETTTQSATENTYSIPVNKVTGMRDLNAYNYQFMLKAMKENINSLSDILAGKGDYAMINGSGSFVTFDRDKVSYTEANDYITNFQSKVDIDERQGYNSTSRISNYPGTDRLGSYYNVNQIYQTSENLYPDERGTGSFTNKWKVNNSRSILNTTQKLFRENKINTIISAFHTKDGNAYTTEGTRTAKSNFGESHGRNLLTYDAEVHGEQYRTNGYNNPYCRVWTHHHMYARTMNTLMRPFAKGETPEGGKIVNDWDMGSGAWTPYGEKPVKMELGFSGKTDADGTKINEAIQTRIYDENGELNYGWRNETGTRGYQFSVLNNKSGFLNIAPQYATEGGNKIHPKDCMLSIENLAWRDYDPYSFEDALSWEQRGPFGGRIMWFPPYGLEFSEDTNVQWSEHQFIGRGEPVYTYTNTQRTGTLKFMMVVDHPSIIDYAVWHQEYEHLTHKTTKGGQISQNVTDTDILRYFAGCDGGKEVGTALRYKVRPTLLTDEIKKVVTVTKDNTVFQESVFSRYTPPQETPVEQSTPDKIVFYVFFPNNYSGHYDYQDNTVHPIAYIINGQYAQKKGADVTSEDESISIDDVKKESKFENGYEMFKQNGMGFDENNRIVVIDKCKNNRTSAMEFNNGKRKYWSYRVDGTYDCKNEGKKTDNKYHEHLVNEKGMIDQTNFSLNSTKDNWNILQEQDEDAKNNEISYTLLQMFNFIYGREGSNPKLNDFFKGGKSFQVEVKGYASSHGHASRNENLSLYRAQVVKWWLESDLNKKIKEINGDNTNRTISYQIGNTEIVSVQEEKMEDALIPKTGRRAKVTIIRTPKKIEEVKEQITNNEQQNNQQGSNSTTGDTSATGKATATGENQSQNTNNNNNNVEGSDVRQSNAPRRGGLLREGNDNEPYTVSGTVYGRNSDGKEKLIGATIRVYKKGSDEVDNELSTRTDEDGFFKIEGLTDEYIFKISFVVYETKNFDIKRGDIPTEFILESAEKIKGVTITNDRTSKVYKPVIDKEKVVQMEKTSESLQEYNRLRYDQEYYFFRQLELRDKPLYDTLVKKLKYFIPAYHSMTPEGFTGRLTFLQQCTRQGNTISISDRDGKSANNLAFGRQPYCILRLGDFYYQKIVIRNMNISYDPLTLDLNPEGAGVVPLLATVSINFSFVGGGDMTGPVKRLQNAMSFNYYANTRLYDNRADRMEYESKITDTIIGNNSFHSTELDINKSHIHNVPMS